ncbi:hypothetical protein G6F57_016270 [Rhizopus arrhizus]|nr:hypothetical protein G6F57_016270 [Rhizopus arrhizus]
MVAVGGAGGDPRTDRTGFVDAFLQDLPVPGFLVVAQLAGVLRGVQLAEPAQFRVLQQAGEDAHEAHGGGLAAIAAALQLAVEDRQRWQRQRIDPGQARRQLPAQDAATLGKVDRFGAARFRAQVGHLLQLFVADRQIEAVAERTHRVGAHLLQLVVDVLAFAGFTHAKALDRLGQDHGGPAAGVHCLLVGGVHLLRIVATTRQRPDVVVAHVRDQVQQFGIAAEEVLAHIRAVLRLEGLVVAIHAFHHALAQQAAMVAGQEVVPATAPDQLDHVPAGRAEGAFQLLDDLAVAAYRTVQALQVAVDHEHEVVQPRAAGQRNRRQ